MQVLRSIALALASLPRPAAGDFFFAAVLLGGCSSPAPPPQSWAATLQGCIVAANGSLSGRLACAAANASAASMDVFINGDCSWAPFGSGPIGDVSGCFEVAPGLALETSCGAGRYVPPTNESLTIWSVDAASCPPGADAVLNLALTTTVPTACVPDGADSSLEISCDAASQELRVLEFGGADSCAGAPRNVTAAPLGCVAANANATVYAETCGQRQPFSAPGSSLSSLPLTLAPLPPTSPAALHFAALSEAVGAWAVSAKARAVAAIAAHDPASSPLRK